MVNTRISNSTVNVGVKSSIPNVRVSNFQTGILSSGTSGRTINPGQSIGLLLALTYATQIIISASVTTFIGDGRPNVRITNN
jgi:hypothetical protein